MEFNGFHGILFIYHLPPRVCMTAWLRLSCLLFWRFSVFKMLFDAQDPGKASSEKQKINLPQNRGRWINFVLALPTHLGNFFETNLTAKAAPNAPHDGTKTFSRHRKPHATYRKRPPNGAKMHPKGPRPSNVPKNDISIWTTRDIKTH